MEIDTWQVITYNPVGDYGGWGIGSGKKVKRMTMNYFNYTL